MSVPAARIATGAVLFLVVAGAVFLGPGWPFTVLVGAVAAACGAEYFRMFFRAPADVAWGGFLTAAAYAVCALLPEPPAAALLGVCVLLAAFRFLSGDGPAEEKARGAASAVLGMVYVGVLLAAWPRAIRLPRGPHWVMMGLVAVAAGDTFAYFAGRAFGARKLAPRISPNKTVEGGIGGLLGSTGLGAAYAAVFLPPLSPALAALLCAAVGAVGQAGDLFESLLKRAAGVKDSGAVLPGHGGIFDRVDGLLPAGPVLYLLGSLLAGNGWAG